MFSIKLGSIYMSDDKRESHYPSRDHIDEIPHSLPNAEENWPSFHQNALFERAALEVSEFVQVADEMALTSALGAMSAACQGLADVSFPNGHRAPCSLMTLVIAGSGERKTSVDQWFCQPIKDVETEKRAQDSENRRHYQHEYRLWKKKLNALDTKIISQFNQGEPTDKIEDRRKKHIAEQPLAPKEHQLIYNDTTPEALAQGLHTNLPIGYLLSDESGKAFEKRGALQDAHFANDLWNGTSIPVNRKGYESFFLDEPRLTASLMIQPEILQQVLKKQGDRLHESGLLARILVVHPTPQAGFRENLSYKKPATPTEQFRRRVRERMHQSIERLENGSPRDCIEFSPQAQKLWEHFNKSIEEQIRPDGIYYHTPSHASKLMENVSRVAGIIHLFENDDFQSEITEAELQYAYDLCCHYSKHYIDNIAGEPKVVTLANELIRTIRKCGTFQYSNNRYRFNRSIIKQRAITDLRDNDNLNAALKLLTQLGHVKHQENKSTYVFDETLSMLTNTLPERKNGELYYVRELPPFEESKDTISQPWQPRMPRAGGAGGRYD